MFTKIALREISPWSFVFFRYLIGTLTMLPSLAILKQKPQRKDLIRGAQLTLLLGGIMLFQTIGLQTIAASLSAFLTGFSVVFILGIRFVTQRKAPRPVDILATLACIVGLGLVTGSHGLSLQPGVLYTLGCALCVALYIHTLSAYAQSSSTLLLTLLQMVGLTCLTGSSTLLLEGELPLPRHTSTWGAILFCGVFCSAICFAIQAYAQKHMSAFKAAAINTLEPVFATIFSYLFLNEVLSAHFYAGAALILGAIVLINWRLESL